MKRWFLHTGAVALIGWGGPALAAEPLPAAPPASDTAEDDAPPAEDAPTLTPATTLAPAPRPSAAARPSAPPPGLSPADALAWQAGRLLDEGQLPAGEAKAQSAVAADGRSADGHFQLARALFMRGESGKAGQEANMALAVNPRHVGALFLLLRIQAAQGTVQQSLTRLQELANANRDDLGVQLAYGEVQLLIDKHDGATAAVGRVLKKAETSVAAMKLLARVYLGLKRPMTAEYVLQRVIELERDPEALCLLAGIRFDEGKVVEARVLLEEAVNSAPGYLEALNSLGVVYIEVRNYEAAVEVLQRAVTAAPGFVAALLDLGSAQRGAGAFEAAERSWKKVLELDAKRVKAWFNLGVLYLENPLPGRDRVKQLGDAISAFNGFKTGAGKEADAEADKYIGEARLLLKQEEERRKEQLKTPPPEGGEDGGGETPPEGEQPEG